MSSARRTLIGKPASRVEINAHARRLAYLGTVDKVLAGLQNEFGKGCHLPSMHTIQTMIDQRNRPMRSIHVEDRRV